ncbi:LolA family protein, partial [Eudoraea sp.]
MKNVILLAVLFLTITSGKAQNADKAKALLDEVYNKVMSYENIEVNFKYSLQNEEAGINQETRGDVTLEGDKYLFDYMGSQQLYDGKKVYTIVPENEEVTIEDKSTDSNTIT